MADNNLKMRSVISDDDLAKMIEEDKKKNPSDFSCGPVVHVDSLPVGDMRSVTKRSRKFETVRKWL